MNDDLVLLRRYFEEGCEESFRALVEKHLPVVYGAALRRVGGDRHLAEDVSQHVFIELARCAGRLSADVIVAGWLYRATGFTAAKFVRSERRRKDREAAAAVEEQPETMNAPNQDAASDWDALQNDLDAAMDQLEELHRNAILLRYFQNQDYRKRTEDTNATATGNLVNYGLSMGRIHADHQYGICQFFNDPEERGGYHARVGGVSWLESLVPNANFPGASNRFDSKENLFEQSAFFPTASRDLSLLRGRWHHLAGTFRQLDGNRVRMIAYFDGEKRNQIVLSGCLANTVNIAPLSIGGFLTSPFKGCIDEIRIFDRELGAHEVKALFLR